LKKYSLKRILLSRAGKAFSNKVYIFKDIKKDKIKYILSTFNVMDHISKFYNIEDIKNIPLENITLRHLNSVSKEIKIELLDKIMI